MNEEQSLNGFEVRERQDEVFDETEKDDFTPMVPKRDGAQFANISRRLRASIGEKVFTAAGRGRLPSRRVRRTGRQRDPGRSE
jgi:hypothetical protein